LKKIQIKEHHIMKLLNMKKLIKILRIFKD
jgi:hypothetical protein